MLDLWDEMSPQARKMVIFVARAVAQKEGVLPEGMDLLVLGRKK